MHITKILETSIDLFSPEDIYAVDVPKLLLTKLNERYMNKCFSSILIFKVVEILRYSDRIMVDNRLDGAAYINVQFKVEGLILNKGEVLQGCKVVNTTSFGVIIRHPYAVGIMTQDPQKKAITVLKKDQIVPVIIDDVRYNIGKPQITITCKPYTPQPFPEIYYNITEVLSPDETEKINALLVELAEEKKLHANVKNNKSYEFFNNLLYPYKTVRKFNMSPLGSTFSPVIIELKELTKIKDGCITNVDLNLDQFIVHSKKIVNSSNLQVINSPLYPALSSIIFQKIQFMRTLREFAEQYDTPEKNQQMMAYWKICMSLKE
jgi:DNA-directed RNA polymerase subunit E'/Rpb7